VKLHKYCSDPTFLLQGLVDGVVVRREDEGEVATDGGGVEEVRAAEEAEEERHDSVRDLLGARGVDVDEA